MEYRLIQADSKQQRERDQLTFPEWGQSLRLDQFLKREQRLRAHPWAASGMKTWFLLDSRGEVLSSCETFKMTCVNEGIAQGIASVYTEPRFRKRGYAARMITALTDTQSPLKETQAWILFSEIGESLYRSFGFQRRPSFDRSFQPSPHLQSIGDLRLLAESDLPDFWKTVTPILHGFIIWPTSSQLDWHLERARIYSDHLKRASAPYCGATLNESILIWAVDFKSQNLRVLFFRSAIVHEAEALLSKACAVAHQLGLRGVLAWESDEFQAWDQLAFPSQRTSRDDALAMIRSNHVLADPHSWKFIPRALWI